VKSENAIDRITSQANPRTLERVPAGARFSVRMVMDVLCKEDAPLFSRVLEGLRMLEDDALGGGGSPQGKRSVYVPPARAGGGGLPDKVSPGDINGAVAQRMDSLRRCVSEQKAREPDASGTLRMRWLIQADGSPRDVKCITPEYAKGEFAQCIAGVIRTVQFPRSTTRGQEVTFPFNF
jgi:hypothetical protein